MVGRLIMKSRARRVSADRAARLKNHRPLAAFIRRAHTSDLYFWFTGLLKTPRNTINSEFYRLFIFVENPVFFSTNRACFIAHMRGSGGWEILN